MDRAWTILVRAAGVLALLALIGVCISDFQTKYWVDHAMLTAVLAALLIAIVAGALVDNYLGWRDRQRWRKVAAIANGEFATVARWLRRVLLDAAGLEAPDDPEETQRALASPDEAARISAAVDALAHDHAGRARLYARISDIVDGAGTALGRWSPLMVQGEHVTHLNAFVDLAGRNWKLQDELSKEQIEHREIPLGEDWVAGRIAKLVDLAGHLEVEFNAAARDLSPVEDWMGAPDWFRPPPERVGAPTG